MSATGFTPIQLYYSITAAATPSAGNLDNGELAINITDGRLFYKDNGGTVQVLATKAGASGDVVGPASATDNALARFNSTTGKLVQNSVGILDDSGNLGLGLPPSAWDTAVAGGPALQIRRAALLGTDNNFFLTQNGYYGSGATYRYIATGVPATGYQQFSGEHRWFTADSGTADDAISFTQAATLTANGEYLVGLTSATGVAKLQVSGPLRTTGYTVATLPAGTVGMRTYVTDALVPVALATVVGGGSVVVPVFYNGSNWIVA